VLAGTLALGDVGDVESLARRALDDWLHSKGAHLRPQLYEDCLQHLLAVAWELWQRFDPGRGLSFSTYCYRTLKLRIVDWYRHEFGDSRYGERPQVLSLDGPGARSSDSPRETLGEQIAHSTAAPADDFPVDVDVLRELDGSGVLSKEGSWTLREIALPHALGLSKDEIAARIGRSRRFVNRCLDDLQVEYSGLEGRLPMPKKPKTKVPPTRQPTVLPPSCDDCLNYVLAQLEREGLSRPAARSEAERTTRMVWIDRGKTAICRICNPDVVPNRATRRATGWKPKPNRQPARSPEISANLEKERKAEAERKAERDRRRAEKRRKEQLGDIAGDLLREAAA
jgi:Sigma-70 region 2